MGTHGHYEQYRVHPSSAAGSVGSCVAWHQLDCRRHSIPCSVAIAHERNTLAPRSTNSFAL